MPKSENMPTISSLIVEEIKKLYPSVLGASSISPYFSMYSIMFKMLLYKTDFLNNSLYRVFIINLFKNNQEASNLGGI
ncbi:hypothetical protein [Spiroplasma sp. AdecLV25b]|uniref:hypothetical protein n=1 Tax=Spiroplasma sp. AdecLV25b TaxID=3027162 RepID=UPI0027E03092|nr:hypothetical protein [Spiroplasma sp. AdecLV25b]